MKTKEVTEIDSDGYIKVPRIFEQLGYRQEMIEDFGDFWYIYKRTNLKTGFVISYELVKLKRSEKYVLKNNIIPKKWSYPGDSSFGRLGFACNSLERARRKYKEIKDKKQEESKEESKIQIPAGVKFTVSGLVKTTGAAYHKIVAAIAALGEKVRQVDLIKNKIGKPTKVLVYNP